MNTVDIVEFVEEVRTTKLVLAIGSSTYACSGSPQVSIWLRDLASRLRPAFDQRSTLGHHRQSTIVGRGMRMAHRFLPTSSVTSA